MRISVTDRCNLRCTYCMPTEGVKWVRHEDILSYEEITSIVQAAASVGISKVRVSGGEPLVRIDLPKLIAMLAQVQGIDDISLTTNGVLLKKYAAELKEAGLSRVNISLDSLRRGTFKKVTRRDKLPQVMAGIEEANRVGLEPVKINVVVMKGINDHEIGDFALKSMNGWHVRFIELMPFTNGGKLQPEFMPVQEMLDRLQSLGDLEACGAPPGNGPARYYRLSGATGTVGFITPVSEHFCFQCNRLRLSADGKLLPCLLSDKEVDLRPSLRQGAGESRITDLIMEAIASKPAGHRIDAGEILQKRLMTQVGG